MSLADIRLMYDFNLNYLSESHPDNSKWKRNAKNMPFFPSHTIPTSMNFFF